MESYYRLVLNRIWKTLSLKRRELRTGKSFWVNKGRMTTEIQFEVKSDLEKNYDYQSEQV